MSRNDRDGVVLSAFLSEAEIVAMAEAFGGIRLYMPVSMTERHRISKVIGHDAALRLRDAIGHGIFRMPLARELRLFHYRKLGLSNAKIARKLGMTETGVDKIIRRGVAGVAKQPAK